MFDRWRPQWPPYVPVAERRRRAAVLIARFRKGGKALSPIQVEGRAIARTFWGDAWCRNLERYSDYANRLPRGRTYLRNGSVVDLRIGPREVRALVSGSSLYKVVVRVSPVSPARWRAMCKHFAAVFYGIGARVDERPELFFTLRAVDQNDLIARAGKGLALAKKPPAGRRVLDRGNLSEIFGLEMAPGDGAGAGRGTGRRPARGRG